MDKDLAKILKEANARRRAKQQETSECMDQTGQQATQAAGKDAEYQNSIFGIQEQKTDYEKAKFLRDLAFHGIDKRFQDVTVFSIEHRLPGNENIRRNWSAVKGYISNIERHIEHGEGLILAGSYGTMKTTMSVAVLRHWLSKDKGGGYLVPMATMIDNLYSMRMADREEAARYENRLRTTPLLVIDDLGAENTAQDWILSKTDSIITERYNKMKATIITTNQKPRDLENTYGGRIIDRIKSSCFYLEFNGASERKPLNLEDI